MNLRLAVALLLISVTGASVAPAATISYSAGYGPLAVPLARAYAGAGRREDALRILEEVRGSALYPLSVAHVYAALGEADVTFEWLEKAYERRSLALTWIGVYPGFDPLRSDPRFDDLLRRIGFPES